MNDNTVTELTPSVRTIARQEGIDLTGLITILELRRPDQTKTERVFAEGLHDYLAPKGAQMDSFGNIYLTIGEKPNVMWSCHTDTVSKDGGRQNLKWNGDILSLNQGKPGMSLGADDGAGLWLLLELIKVDKPGLYIFHRAEEVGRLGSKHISAKQPELLAGIEIAIAFDRRGNDSIITHQSSRRSCSDKFADALGAALGTNFKKDPTGSYTDTFSYVDQIAECTNVSVGYKNEHGPMETLDVAHLFRLREALLKIDTSTLPVERDPSSKEYDDDDRWGSYGGFNWGASSYAKEQKEIGEIEAMIKAHPRTFARWFHQARMDADVLECMFGSWIKPKPNKVTKENSVMGGGSAAAADYFRRNELADADLADEVDAALVIESGYWCDDCGEAFESRFVDDWFAGQECDNCFGRNTIPCDVALDPVSGDVLGEADEVLASS